MDGASDEELVREIATGGASAHAAEAILCRRFAPRIRAYGMRHLRDEERARDLVQTVLVGVLEAARAGRIDDLGKVDRFVLGTCRNATSRMRSAAARAEPVSDDVIAAIAVEPFEVIDTPALLRCIDTLESRAKQVLLLAFHEERSAEDIATALQISAGNVRVVRHRALHALRRCLDAREARA